jgi:acyl dehydratase
MPTEWMTPFLRYESMAWDEIAEGDELPAVEREVDPTLVVAGAIASRDFYPVHHDKAFAEQAGSPDIFLNILTTNGLMAAYVTNWCGPAWDLVSIELRLKVPAFPGQKLTTTGTVTAKHDTGGDQLVDLAFTSATEFGPHCSGTATIRRADG